MKGLGLSVFFAVILIGVLGALFVEDVLIKPITPTREPSSDAPVYFFEDFTMRVMNEQGHLAYVLAGKSMAGYRGNDKDAQIELPRLAIDAAPRASWGVTANDGVVTRGGDRLRLQGRVVLQREAKPPKPPLRIETDTLDVDTRQRIATTHDDVHITAAHWQVRSTGMQANLGSGLLDLLADVHARFTPEVAP